jgi:Na+/proline symporter
LNLHYWDWLIIVVYAITVLAIGLWVVRKPQSSEGYFLAGRRLRWPFIGPWLHGAFVAFLICMAVLVGVTLLTKPSAPEKLASTTVDWSGARRTPARSGAEPSGPGFTIRDYRLWFSAVAITTAVLWYAMR